MSRAGDGRRELAARAAAVTQTSASAQPTASPQLPGSPPARPPRTRPVRVTVELSPMEHQALRQWCARTSAELDLPLVAGAEVFRALLSLMRDQSAVADQVRAELARTGGSRRRHQ